MIIENNHDFFVSILIIFRFISKICDFVDYLKWKREIFEMLKWNSFWKYIKVVDDSTLRQSADFEKNAKLSKIYIKWWENDDHTRIALRNCVKKNLYCDIINCKIVEIVWNIIKKICESKNSAALMTIFVKYKNLKCDDCEFFYQYDVKFRKIDNELIIYSEVFKMNLNWFIYQYLVNLFQSVDQFIDRWITEHEFFNNAIKNDSKNDVTTVMHVYEFQCANSIDFSTHNDIDVVFLIIDLTVDVVKKIVDESMIMIFKCDYISCDKNDH